MQIWTSDISLLSMLFYFFKVDIVYFVYNGINNTLYSNQSIPVYLLYFSEIIFVMQI
jgi:hypothetical protein